MNISCEYNVQNSHSLKYNFSQFITAIKAQYDLDCVDSAVKLNPASITHNCNYST